MDLGTNSFHLLVADVHPDGHLDPLVREKEMLRLGDVVSRQGSIPPTAADQAVATVRRFRLLAEAAGATELHAKATSAIRRAENGAELVDRIEEETGIAVDVISGHEEARLIFGAIRASVVLDPAPAVCFDLGGGSLEVMVGDTRGMQWATSLPLGVARLTTELVHSDPLSKRDRRALQSRIVEELATIARRSPRLPPQARGREQRHPRVPRPDGGGAARRGASLLAQPAHHHPRRARAGAQGDPRHRRHRERLRMDGLDARRVDLIVAGSMFLATAMEALRDRVPHDLGVGAARGHRARRRRPPRPADSHRAIRERSAAKSVQSLGRRCNWPEAHSRQVAVLALELFDATQELHGLGADERELLEHAAFLHDIGEHVSSSGHHRHSAYLVRNGQLRGFAPDEIEMLAALVRWHRSGDPRVSDEFPSLDADAIGRVRVLTALLRVGDGLDRGREQPVYGLDTMITPSLVLVRLRTRDDAELEIWGARRKRALFEKVFDREMEFTTHPRWAEERTATSRVSRLVVSDP